MLMNRKLVVLGLLFVTLGLNASNQQITDLDQAFRDECANYQKLDELPIYIIAWESEQYKKRFVLNADNRTVFPVIYNAVEKAAEAVGVSIPQILLSKGSPQGAVFAWNEHNKEGKKAFIQVAIGLDAIGEESVSAYELELLVRQQLYGFKDRDLLCKLNRLSARAAQMIYGATAFNIFLPVFSPKIYSKLGYSDQMYGVFKIGKHREFACWSNYATKDIAVILLVMGCVGGYLAKKLLDLIKEKKALRLDDNSTGEQLASLREKKALN